MAENRAPTKFVVDSRGFRADTRAVGVLAYFSLGSNLGNRVANLRSAVSELDKAGSIRAISSLYETQPVDVPNQPWFLNCAVALETSLTPRELLKVALAVESEMGRVRFKEKGPRIIDIDLLLVGDCALEEPGLKIPHPSMQRRRFVLEPLVEIAPEAFHPALKKTAAELLADLGTEQTVRKFETEEWPDSKT
jgi:2-amino-4-hydroxy-6-hydroxymethyldihydropteridine diphosphokinase